MFKVKILQMLTNDAVDCYFSVRTGQIRNIESAKVSMVGQLKR